MDNPDLIAACVVGDGEAGNRLSGHRVAFNKFLNPKSDGAVLPILISTALKSPIPPSLPISHEEAEMFFKGCGWEPRFVEGDDPMVMHQKMAAALDWAVREIQRIQEYARSTGDVTRPRCPMIVFALPRGGPAPRSWTDSPLRAAGSAHQVPIAVHDGAPGASGAGSLAEELPPRGAVR